MTQQQHIASSPEHSVWVSANAGTGKTKVLTDRVLRLLLQDISPGRILCLTFTNAAAAEMASRINATLSGWVMADDEHLKNELLRLTALEPDKELLTLARTLFSRVIDNPGSLKIQTIHSFCQSLLRRFPLEAGVSSFFQVIDAQTAGELTQEAWQRLLAEGKDPALKQAIAHFAGTLADSSLKDLIGEIIAQRPGIEALLKQRNVPGLIDAVYARLGVEKGESVADIIAGYSDINNININELRKLSEVLLYGTDKDKERSQIIADYAAGKGSFAQYKSVFLTATDDPKQLSSIITKKPLERFPDADVLIAREQERLLEIIEKIHSVTIAELTQSFIIISDALLELYRYLKVRQGFLDYNDLIITAKELLTQKNISPWVMYKLDESIDHVLLDEAQDTSREQWAIIRALCEEFFAGKGRSEIHRTLFVVGDEKQSIFSFQGANPQEFHAMQQFFGEHSKQAEQPWQTISLGTSFRSTPPVLALVDSVFSDPALRRCITQSDIEIMHNAHRNGQAGLVELWPVITPLEKKAKPEKWPLPSERIRHFDPQNTLAQTMANTIKGWLEEKRLLRSKHRPVTPGDIIILVRQRNDFVDKLSSALKKQDIPIAGTDRLLLTDYIAIEDLIALGNFLLLPGDDLTLAAILKSPLIGMDEEQLFTLAYDRGKISLWQRLQEKKGEQPVFATAHAYLADLLRRVDFAPPYELYSTILDTLGGRKAFISRLGHEVNDPLNEFLNLCFTFEHTHTPGLQGFLHWVAVGKAEVVRNMEKSSDAIRIMTVHASKGLQAPIVFLPDTTALPKARSNNILWTEEGDLLFPGKKTNYNRLCEMIDKKNTEATYEEYIRLLYVALTRAEDELYICGWSNNAKIHEKSWYHYAKKSVEATPGHTDFAFNREEDTIGLRISSDQAIAGKSTGMATPIEEHPPPLPAWAFSKPEEEPQGKVTLFPSMLGEEPKPDKDTLQARFARERGTIIHKLLETLPGIMADQRKNKAARLLQSFPGIPDEEKTLMLAEALTVLEAPEFQWIFEGHSKAEVPVAGTLDGNPISGQIDRLVIGEDEIVIIDYKTDANPPEDIPPSYLSQMEAYTTLLRQIYPDKPVKCTILWTSIPCLQEIASVIL